MPEPANQQDTDASTSKDESPSISEVDRETAQRYLAIARTTIPQTSTVAILWLVSILVIWGSIERNAYFAGSQLKSVARDYVKAYKAERIEQSRGKQTQSKVELYTHSETKKLSETVNRKEDENHLNFDEESTQASIGNQPGEKKLREKFYHLLTKPIEFPLPGFTKFESTLQAAPPLLAGVILGLAGYVAFMRERVFRYLSKALCLLKKDSRVSINALGDVLAPRPWWVTPLPRKLGESILPEQFASSFGWSSHKEASSVLPALFWLTLIYVQYRLIIIHSFIVGGITFPSDYGIDVDDWGMRGLSGLNWVFFGMTVSVAARWFWVGSVPDKKLLPRREISLSRRTFLIHATVGITLAIVVNCTHYAVNQLGRPALVKRPRYRKKRVHTLTYALKDGLLVNPKSGVVHAVYDRRVIGLNYRKAIGQKPKIEEWQVLSVQDLSTQVALSLKSSPTSNLYGKPTTSTSRRDVRLRANKSYVSAITELAFRRALDEKQYRIAEYVMKLGLEQDITFKRNAGIMRAIDMNAGSIGKSRRKPRKRHTGKQNISSNLSSPGKRNVRRFPKVSFRLYDSLARASVNLVRQDWLKDMLMLIDCYELRTLFESRIANWENPNSEWYRGVIKQGRSSNVG